MTDVLPQMRHFLKEGPITKTVDKPCELTMHRIINTNITPDPSKDIRALLPQMDAFGRHHLRGAALANSHTNDFPVPGTA